MLADAVEECHSQVVIGLEQGVHVPELGDELEVHRGDLVRAVETDQKDVAPPLTHDGRP
jgi:hypothetical protein